MRLTALAFLMLSACAGEAETPIATKMETPVTAQTAHQIDFTSIDGAPMPLSGYAGKAVLVVNTASRCGYTPQYAGLQDLHETFADKGLVILGAPSNDFGGQEPGAEAEVKTFCEINYGVTFPLTSKVHASGADRHAFWNAAADALGDAAEPKWNFHKVLIGPEGQFLKAYPSATKPADAELVADIEAALPG